MLKRSAAEKIDRYQRKIQRLWEKSETRRRVRVIYSDSDSEGSEAARSEPEAEANNQSPESRISNPDTEPVAREPTAEPEVLSPDEQSQQPAAVNETPPESEVNLDPELLQALGESTGDSPDYGPQILDNLAKLWTPLLKKGMPKEAKDKTLKEYLTPDNCHLLQAPKLNAEISAAILDGVRNRDKGLISQQQQLGAGITAVNRALDILLKGEDKKQAIQHLSNACRVLTDLHATLTQNRVKLITPNLDKNFVHVIQDTERDETLFGNKLSEKIKAAKAIEKQGLQIKRPIPKPNAQQAGGSRASPSGNWLAPPRYSTGRGGRGGPRRGAAQNRRPYQSPAPAAAKPLPSAANKRVMLPGRTTIQYPATTSLTAWYLNSTLA